MRKDNMIKELKTQIRMIKENTNHDNVGRLMERNEATESEILEGYWLEGKIDMCNQLIWVLENEEV